MTRQLAVAAAEEPDLWQVELVLEFEDTRAAAAAAETGFRFEPVGPARAAAIRETRALALAQPLVRALWSATPVSSAATFERV